MDSSYDFPKSKFYEAMMTGVFVGFFTTVVCLIYDIIFRESTGFPLSSFINVTTIILVTNLLFLLIGIIYYLCISSFRKGNVVFVPLLVLLTLMFGWIAVTVQRTEDPMLNLEFRKLLSGIVLIIGLSATIFIPLLYRNQRFRNAVL